MKRTLALLLATTMLFSACGTRAESPSVEEPSLEESSLLEESSEPDPVSEESIEEIVLPPEESSEESSESSEESSSYIAMAPPSTLKDVTITDETINNLLGEHWEYLNSLDNTAITWGPGPTSNEVRPSAVTKLQAQYGEHGGWFVAPDSPKIYLTFDEGYEAGYNEAILDALKKQKVSAVFFVTLGFVKSRPDLIQRMINEGHVIGNHSWKHISFPTMDMAENAKDILTLHHFMLENFDYEMNICRPPEGAFSTRTLELLKLLGYDSVLWSFAYRDWILDEQPNATEAKETIVGRSHPGAIYLLHAVSATNAEILEEVIIELRAKGYELSTWDLTE